MINMNEVRGGFKPQFEVFEATLENRGFPNLNADCVPPPNTWNDCLKCKTVFVS